MAKAKSPKVAPVAVSPMAALAATITAAPVAAPAVKVHSVTANGTEYKAANHVAAFKGSRPVAAGGTSYKLTGTPYNPSAGHVNALQWAAVQAALAANGGNPVTVAQVAAQYPAGIAAGNAAGFLAYRAKGAKPNLEMVKG